MVRNKQKVLIILIVSTFSLSFLNKEGFGATYATSIPILTYHDIGNQNNPFTVKPNEFEAHMKYLSSKGYTFLVPNDIDLYIRGKKKYPQKSIMITFDDGCKGVWEYGLPIMKKYRVRATVFIVYSFLERDQYLSFSNLDDIVESNIFFIGSHTYDLHQSFYYKEEKKTIPATLKQIGESEQAYHARVLQDLQKSIMALEGIYPNMAVTTFSYPFGACNKGLEKLVQQAGFQYALSYNSNKRDLMSRNSNPLQIERYPILPGTAPKDLIIH